MSNAQALKQLRLSGGFLAPFPRARFRVSGADRARYLNSQLSNDLRKAVSGTALPCCLLTAKGKMCALVWVFEEGDSWILDADFLVRDALQIRLERYIVADDVQIEDISGEGMLFHLFGEAALNPVAAHGIHASRLGLPGVDIWVLQSRVDAFRQELTRAAILETTVELSEPLRIAQGVPAWGREISEDTLPAEVGLDQFAVDFSKGCYVGQETVSRVRSVGRVRRHLVGFAAENAETILSPVSKIFDSVSRDPVGVLTSTAFHSELCRAVALGYLKTGFTSSEGILLAIHPESGEEAPLRMRKFPLSI